MIWSMLCRAVLIQFCDFVKLSCAVGPPIEEDVIMSVAGASLEISPIHTWPRAALCMYVR